MCIFQLICQSFNVVSSDIMMYIMKLKFEITVIICLVVIVNISKYDVEMNTVILNK